MDLASSLAYCLQPWPLLLLVGGTGAGIVVGAIPGLTGSMLIALSLPFTYYMAPVDAMILLVAMYTGSITGGLISAILLRMPGTPSNVMTTFDGHPMAKQGQAGRALALGVGASAFGSLFAWVALATITEPLSIWATRFGPFEYFTLVVMALVLIASVSQGSLLKGLLAGAVGALFAFPGTDNNTGTARFTFDWWQLGSGFDVLPVLVGAFAVGTLLADCVSIREKGEVIAHNDRPQVMAWADWMAQKWNLLRSAAIGTWIGILPGIGANVGSVVAYTVTKNLSSDPARFGNGAPEGIVASEAANNATIGGALIPLIAMGIPGSVIDVFLMSAMLIHGVQPGPLLFTQRPDLVYAIIASCLLATVAMFCLMTLLTGTLRRLMQVPKHYVLPVVMAFCVVGVFASNSRMFEVWAMLFFGVLGFAMERAKMPLGPFVIGFILAPLAEAKLRSGLMMTAGDWTPIFTRPLPAIFLAISAALLVWPFWSQWQRERKAKARP
ncbi:MAG: tripartite tricarboxylate transporter permease [Thalassobaculales bacterium]